MNSTVLTICIITWIYVILASVLLLARFERVEMKQNQIIQRLQLDHSEIIPIAKVKKQENYIWIE